MKYQDQQYQLFNQLESAFQRGEQPCKIYPQITDYANDPRRCLTIAGWIDHDLATEIDEILIQPLKAVDPRQYYYPQDNLHTTLLTLFLAAAPPLFTQADIDIITKVLTKVMPKLKPITYHLKGLFLMPNSIGIRGYTGHELHETITTIRAALAERGIVIDPGLASDEVYFGHITLCRFITPPNSAFWRKTVELRNRGFGHRTSNTLSLISSNFTFEKKATVNHARFILQ